METPEKISDKASKKKHLGKKVFSFGISPYRQFTVLAAVMLSLLACLVGFHMYLFYRIESHDIFQGVPVQASAPSVNEKRLENVLLRYQAKEAARAAAALKTLAVSDPEK
jgi:hypothetical protein